MRNWHIPAPRVRARVVAAGALALVVLMAGAWTLRHGRAIYALNQGVGGTVFYDADGAPWFHLDDRRQDVPFDRISTFFKDAVIAVEDHRYFLHPGIDPVGVTRAAVHNLSAERGEQGGSTITQQLARTLFLTNVRTYGRKIKEAVLSVMLEAFLSKREILELYMNRIYLGSDIYGIEAMSREAFGKPAADITLAEAALVAGLIRAPATYSPWRYPERARERSLVVLRRMREEGKISFEQEEAARREQVRIAPRVTASSSRHGYAKAFLRRQFEDHFQGRNPPHWKVHTTFVQQVQDAAEAAVRTGLQRLNTPGLQAALVAIDPSTGNLLALVGGADYESTPFNRATQSRRQPGSAFKPFVYAVGLAKGLSPISVISGLDDTSAGLDGWAPRDGSTRSRRTMTLRDALSESNNAAAVALQLQVGARPVIRLARDLGVSDQPDVPSLALGSGLVTPLDLTAAFAVFPGGGYGVRARGLVAVEDAAGDLMTYVHLERQQILSEQVAYQMVSILRDAATRGTAARLQQEGLSMQVAGKTGTTNEAHDAWFVGFSSSVVAGVWIGFDQPRAIRRGASGARVALPIWADFMRRTAGRLPAKPFGRPSNLRAVKMCRLSHQRAGRSCPSYVEHFKPGDEVPQASCALHADAPQPQV